ncbi:xanthine dehydrogenase family protein subunit M [Ferrovibrio sp.]|uniref:FAD binding domain-containing protein n=1 Tax=Ferrovibrio sp. TaxID=1917215 RepID=UPI0035AF0269
MYEFNYHRPTSLAEASKLLAGAADGKFVAGGQTLLPTLKQRLAAPSDLIDLGGIAELQGIKVDGGSVSIGAGTRHGVVAKSAEVAKAIPALAKLAGGIGDAQVRNMGTIGGSLANNDPAADYPAAVLGLNATIHTNKRTIAADDYFKGMFETALEDGEIIVKVSFPIPKRAGYVKFPNPASRYVMVGAMVAETASGIRVAINGAAPCVFRHKEMEAALAKSFSADALKGIKTDPKTMNNDIHASAEYRAHLVGVIAKRAVLAAG